LYDERSLLSGAPTNALQIILINPQTILPCFEQRRGQWFNPAPTNG